MRAVLQLPRRASYTEYLAVESVSEHRHELIDGVIVAMAGGPDERNAITARFGVLLGTRLSAGCLNYSPDQRYWIAAHGRARYCDGSIICGKPQHPSHDDQASTNPVIVVEILSPSSEGDDAGDKRIDYQSLTTLQAYVLVAQDARRVEVYRRDADGSRSSRPDTYRDDDTLELPRLTTAIAVRELYDGILDGAGRSLLR